MKNMNMENILKQSEAIQEISETTENKMEKQKEVIKSDRRKNQICLYAKGKNK